jgi:IS1 family transposase
MNRLNRERQAQVIAALVEGVSINAIVRLTGISKVTILKLLADAGPKCADYQDEKLRNLKCKRVQCDEIWAFCYAKDKNVPAEKRGQFGFGSIWTWVAIDADTKLVPSFLVGNRDVQSAHMFMQDLAHRIDSRIQLTTDGLRAYLVAVQGAFGLDVDFATLHKMYGIPAAGEGEGERRYTPPVCIGCKAQTVSGNPDPEHVSTSYIERQNLSMRMGMRRFTRLTNGFSKKIENHAYAIAVFYMHYNFCRIHKTLRVTPAMEAGLTDHVWTIEEMLDKVSL